MKISIHDEVIYFPDLTIKAKYYYIFVNHTKDVDKT